MSDFAPQHGISATAERVDENPYMVDDTMDHWKVRLRRGRKSMTICYSKGSGHNGAEPTASEVLECLATDASGVDEDFKDWAENLGYSPNSRRAERIYRTCAKQTKRLQRFLGDDLFKTLLYAEETAE